MAIRTEDIPGAFATASDPDLVSPWMETDTELEEFTFWEDLLEDEFAFEKAIYQLNVARDQGIEPGEILMTEYGVGLSTEQIDRMVEEYPGLDTGIDMDRIEEEFGTIESFLKASVKEVDNLLDAVKEKALGEGQLENQNVILEVAGDKIGAAGTGGQTGPLIFNETSGAGQVDPASTEAILRAGIEGEADNITLGSQRVGMGDIVPPGEVEDIDLFSRGGMGRLLKAFARTQGEAGIRGIVGPTALGEEAGVAIGEGLESYGGTVEESDRAMRELREAEARNLAGAGEWWFRDEPSDIASGYNRDLDKLLAGDLNMNEIIEDIETAIAQDPEGADEMLEAWFNYSDVLNDNPIIKSTLLSQFPEIGGADVPDIGVEDSLVFGDSPTETAPAGEPTVLPTVAATDTLTGTDGGGTDPFAGDTMVFPTAGQLRAGGSLESQRFGPPSTTTTGAGTVFNPTDPPGGVGGPEDPDPLKEDLNTVFYNVIYSQPGAGRADAQRHIDSLRGQTQMLFFLNSGLNAWALQAIMRGVDVKDSESLKAALPGYEKISKEQAKTQLEENYKMFLLGYENPAGNRVRGYLENPGLYRSGDAFRERLGLVNRILTKLETEPRRELWSVQDNRDAFWVQGVFGGEAGRDNRRNLIKLQVTGGGQGYYSSRINSSIDSLMKYYKKIGWSDAKVFSTMAGITGKPPVTTTPTAPTTVTDPDLQRFDQQVAESIAPDIREYPQGLSGAQYGVDPGTQLFDEPIEGYARPYDDPAGLQLFDEAVEGYQSPYGGPLPERFGGADSDWMDLPPYVGGGVGELTPEEYWKTMQGIPI